MLRSRRTRAGFTTIELMIALAIVGILASVAIPGLLRFQLRSRAAEGRTNLGSIRTAEEAYFAEVGRYAAAVPTPPGVPDAMRRIWPTPSDFDAFGWQPTGALQFQYAVTISADGSTYTAEALSDLDGDATFSLLAYVRDTAGGSVGGVLGCPASGVWDPVTASNSLLDRIGPCDASSGMSVF